MTSIVMIILAYTLIFVLGFYTGKIFTTIQIGMKYSDIMKKINEHKKTDAVNNTSKDTKPNDKKKNKK